MSQMSPNIRCCTTYNDHFTVEYRPSSVKNVSVKLICKIYKVKYMDKSMKLPFIEVVNDGG